MPENRASAQPISVTVPNSLTWPRRAGRYILRGVRPLFAPILNRIQMRLQTAIEQSSVASGLQQIEMSVDRLKTNLDDLTTNVDKLPESFETLCLRFNDMLTQIELLRVASEAMRLDQEEIFAEIPQLIERHSAAQVEKLDRQDTLLNANHAVQVEKLDRQHTLLNANHAVQSEHKQLSALLMSRADYFLQRITIPLGRDILMRTPEGFLLLPAEDPATVSAVWESGARLEPGTIKVLVALLREGDNAIDVGANVGLTVLPAARKVGPAGRIIALEPGSRTGGLLRQSLVLNGLSGCVSFYPYAAGEAAGSAFLNLGSVLGHSSLLVLPGSETGEEVEIRTIDSLVAPRTRIRLAKLDAEGFEPRVWRGMQRVIADNPALIVLVEFGPEHLRRAGISIEDWLAEFLAPGFTAYEVDEETSHLRPLRSVVELAAVHSLNLLLLRQPTTAFPELRFE